MEQGTVVVVDDERNIAELVELYLEREGFRVRTAADAATGLAAVRESRPRAVVLDIGLPDRDGLELCRELREQSSVPVILLTARDEEVDRVLGLELGADDYVTKPFSPRELVARVKAVLRRTDGDLPAELVRAGRVTVDAGRREVLVDDDAVSLTNREFDLIRFLASRPGRAWSRQQLLDGVWGPGWYGDERTVDVHVAQLRKKLGDAVAITTVRGVGYRLDDTAGDETSGRGRAR